MRIKLFGVHSRVCLCTFFLFSLVFLDFIFVVAKEGSFQCRQAIRLGSIRPYVFCQANRCVWQHSFGGPLFRGAILRSSSEFLKAGQKNWEYRNEI